MKHSFALALFAVLGLAACNTVDNKDMEKKIKDQLSTTFKVKDVSCPSGKSMKEGTTFDCNVKFEDGNSYPIHVTIKADKQFAGEWDADTQAKLVDEMKDGDEKE
jgi:hypothetical protein